MRIERANGSRPQSIDNTIQPPRALEELVCVRRHETERTDPYPWIAGRSDRVMELAEAEN